MNARKIWIALLAAGLLPACGKSTEAPLQAPSGVFVTPVGISNSQSVFVQGIIDKEDQAEIFLIQNCLGTVAASGPSGTFGFSGIQVIIPANTTTFVSTRARRGERFSACSGSVSITHDDVPPAPPVLNQVSVSSSSPLTLRLQGGAEAKSRVRVFSSPTCTGEMQEVNADDAGVFVLQVQVSPNSTHRFSARAVDPANNVSECSVAQTFVHDDIPPAPPQVTSVQPQSPAKATQITISGTAEANASVRLYRDGFCTTALSAFSVTANAEGAFSQQVTVPQNATTQIHGRATDQAGNVSACSTTPRTYVNDTLAPSPPSLGPSNPASPGSSLAFALTVNAEPGASVQVFPTNNCSSGSVATLTMPPGGQAAISLGAASNGTRSFTARATDAAGNVSNCSAVFNYTHDNIPPATPVLTGTTPASPANVGAPTVQGAADPGSTVEIFRTANCGGSVYATATATAGGTFSSSAMSMVTNTTNSLSARALDAAKNPSPCSNSLTYVHDSSAPLAPLLVGTAPPTPARSTTPDVLGLGEPGSTAQVFSSTSCLTSTLLGTAPVGLAFPGSPGGRGAFSVPVTVAPGSSTALAANLKDAVGNTSSCVSVGAAYVHDFNSGWRDEVALDAAGLEGYRPAVATTSTGATAVWARMLDATTSAVIASDYAAGAWDAPVELTPPGNHLQDPLRLAQDGTGGLYAVWSVFGAGRALSAETWAAVRPAGQGWLPADPLGLDAFEPDVAAGGSAGATVAYRAQVAPGESQIHARRWDAVNGWAPAVRVDTTGFSDFAPRVAVTSTGEVLVIFTENSGSETAPNDSLWSARFNGTWLAPQKRSTWRIRRGEYALRSSGPGRAVASWQEAASGTSTSLGAKTSRYASGVFGTPSTHFSSGISAVALGTTPADVSLVLMALDGSLNLYSSRAISSTGTFSTAASLWSTSPALAAGLPVRLAVAPNGTATAAWVGPSRLGPGYSLWLSRHSGTAWGAPQLLAPIIDPMDEVEVAMDASRVVVLWTLTDGAGAKVLRARVLD